jgi:hypothetical protein
MFDACPIVQVTIPSFHGQFAITQSIHYCIHDDGHWGSFGHVSFFFLSFFFVDGVLMCSCVHHQALHN